MGVEVKGAGDGVVIADRGCNDCNYGRNNSGWGSGWGAVGGALVGGGFGAAAVSVWDKINDTKADIQKVESTVQEAKAGIYKDISDAARGVTQEWPTGNQVPHREYCQRHRDCSPQSSDRCSERPEHHQSSGSCLEDRYYNASSVI